MPSHCVSQNICPIMTDNKNNPKKLASESAAGEKLNGNDFRFFSQLFFFFFFPHGIFPCTWRGKKKKKRICYTNWGLNHCSSNPTEHKDVRETSSLMRRLDLGQTEQFPHAFQGKSCRWNLILTQKAQSKSGCKRKMVRIRNNSQSSSMVELRMKAGSSTLLRSSIRK